MGKREGEKKNRGVESKVHFMPRLYWSAEDSNKAIFHMYTDNFRASRFLTNILILSKELLNFYLGCGDVA